MRTAALQLISIASWFDAGAGEHANGEEAQDLPNLARVLRPGGGCAVNEGSFASLGRRQQSLPSGSGEAERRSPHRRGDNGGTRRRPEASRRLQRPFKEHAELPTDLAGGDASKKADRKSTSRKHQRHPKQTNDKAADRKAALAFEKEQKRRERERAKEEAAQRKERERRQKAIKAKEKSLDAARRKHEKNATDIQAQIELLEKRAQAEEARWEKERGRLDLALRRARG